MIFNKNAVSIYNVPGQMVKSSDAPGNSLSVAELPSGMYYAHLTSGGTNTVAKFSKQ